MRILRSELRRIFTRVEWPALRTDIVTAGGLGCVGDLVCQSAVEGDRPFDWRRFTAVGTFEALYMGGLFHFFCQAFPQVVCAVGRQLPGSWLAGRLQASSSAAHAVGCAVVDNIHDGAIMIPSYFVCVGLLQGDSLSTTRRNLGAEWRPNPNPTPTPTPNPNPSSNPRPSTNSNPNPNPNPKVPSGATRTSLARASGCR